MLYQMVTGSVPFVQRRDNWAAVLYSHVHDQPAPLTGRLANPAMRAVIIRLLAKAPSDRFPSALDAARAIESLLGVAPSRAQPGDAVAVATAPHGVGKEATEHPGSAVPAGRPVGSRLPAWGFAVTAGAAASVIAAGLWLWPKGGTKDRAPATREPESASFGAASRSLVSSNEVPPPDVPSAGLASRVVLELE